MFDFMQRLTEIPQSIYGKPYCCPRYIAAETNQQNFSIISGLTTMARTQAQRCRWPPDTSCRTGRTRFCQLYTNKFFYKKLQKDGLPLLFGQNCVERCPGAGLADFFLWQIGFRQGAGQDYAPRLIFCPIQILPPG